MKLICARAFPGAGKSFYCDKLAITQSLLGLKVARFSADYFFARLGRFVASLLGKAHGECQDGVRAALRDKVDVIIVDNTNLRASELKTYADLAFINGYEFEIHQVECDPAIAFARQTHGVPKDKHDAMVKLFNSAVLPPEWKIRRFSGETGLEIA